MIIRCISQNKKNYRLLVFVIELRSVRTLLLVALLATFLSSLDKAFDESFDKPFDKSFDGFRSERVTPCAPHTTIEIVDYYTET